MKLIHVIESIITSRDPNIRKITDKEYIDIIKLCIDNLENHKSLKKVYEMAKREYDYDKD
jgi:hypothetical protein